MDTRYLYACRYLCVFIDVYYIHKDQVPRCRSASNFPQSWSGWLSHVTVLITITSPCTRFGKLSVAAAQPSAQNFKVSHEAGLRPVESCPRNFMTKAACRLNGDQKKKLLPFMKVAMKSSADLWPKSFLVVPTSLWQLFFNFKIAVTV